MRNRHKYSTSRTNLTKLVPRHLKTWLISTSIFLYYPQQAKAGDAPMALNQNLQCSSKVYDASCISHHSEEPKSENSLYRLAGKTQIQFTYNSVLISEHDLRENKAGIVFSRYYNSTNNTANLGFGSGWSSNFHNRLLFRSSNHLQLLLPTGSLIDFYRSGDTYRATNPFYGRIIKQGDYHTWEKGNNENHFFKGSLPVKFSRADGSSLTLHYVDNLLSEVKVDSKTAATFHYNSGKQVTKVSVPNNRTIHYGYENNLLTKVVSKIFTAKNSKFKKNSDFITTQIYNYQTEKPSKYPSLISGKKKYSNGFTQQLFDISYGKKSELESLTDYINSREIHIFETKTNSELHPKEIHTVANIIDINCSPCRPETNIYFSENGSSTGLKRGSFQANWQQRNEESEYIFSSTKRAIDDKSKHTLATHKVNVIDRDISGKPTQIDSLRFGNVGIELEAVKTLSHASMASTSTNKNQEPASLPKAHGTSPNLANAPTQPMLFRITNNINTILHPISESKKERTRPSSELTPHAMAEESGIIIHLDTLARALTPEHCQTPGYPLPGEDEFNTALDSIPDEQEEYGNPECEGVTAEPGTDNLYANLPALTGPATLNGSFLDIRPENCNSYFDIQNPIRRGNAIEEAVTLHEDYSNAIHTVHWFPAVDFVLGRTAVVQISKDLNAQSYSVFTNPNALFNRLLYEGRMINERFLLPLAENGSITASDRSQSTTIRQEQIDDLRFELIVKQGSISPAQQIQIELAREELLFRYNIHFTVVNIP